MKVLPVLLVPLVLSVLACASTATSPGTVERRLTIMGTTLDLHIEAADREHALLASERAVESLEAAEARLSTWRDDTELARLNAAPAGQPVPLSPALARDLAAARRCWEDTYGAFDPSVGRLVQAWGLRQGGRRPGPAELAEARAAVGLDGLQVQDGAATRERAGLVLEEGGFGKGAGLADALSALAADPSVHRAVLDLGGQVAVLGRGGRETVRIADPRRRDRPVVALTVDGGSVSTSGNSERGITVDGRRLGHILDPRTGEPAPDFGSLTVWTADPLRADCLSTGLYVRGPQDALAWAVLAPDVQVIVLKPEGDRLKAMVTRGLKDRLEILTDDVDVEYWSCG